MVSQQSHSPVVSRLECKVLLKREELREVLVEIGSRGDGAFLSDGLVSKKSLRWSSLSRISSRVL